MVSQLSGKVGLQITTYVEKQYNMYITTVFDIVLLPKFRSANTTIRHNIDGAEKLCLKDLLKVSRFLHIDCLSGGLNLYILCCRLSIPFMQLPCPIGRSI